MLFLILFVCVANENQLQHSQLQVFAVLISKQKNADTIVIWAGGCVRVL